MSKLQVLASVAACSLLPGLAMAGSASFTVSLDARPHGQTVVSPCPAPASLQSPKLPAAKSQISPYASSVRTPRARVMWRRHDRSAPSAST
jgi:hypothetical protein